RGAKLSAGRPLRGRDPLHPGGAPALLDRDLAPLGPERRARAASRAARERAAAGGALRTRTEMKRARAAQSLISVRVLEPDGVAEKQVRAQRERGRGGEPVDLDPGERERP